MYIYIYTYEYIYICIYNILMYMHAYVISESYQPMASEVIGLSCARALARLGREVVLCDLSGAVGTGERGRWEGRLWNT